MSTRFSLSTTRYLTVLLVGIGIVAAAMSGAVGVANAAPAAGAQHVPIFSPSSIETKSVVPTMNMVAQDQPAAAKKTPPAGAKPAVASVAHATTVSPGTMSHYGVVNPPGMMFASQDHPAAPSASTPTQVDTSGESISHTGPVIPPGMTWSQSDVNWSRV